MFLTTWIPDSCSYSWSTNALATFCNSTCLVIHALMWKAQEDNPWLHVLIPQKMHRPLKVTWSSLNPHIHDPMFRLCTLFNPTLDSLDVNMIAVFHPTHSHVPLHTQMILGNFLQFPQTHQHWCFHPPPGVPLVHSIWRCRLIHKPKLYTSYNIPPLTSHWFWTWDFLQLIKYYRTPCSILIFIILNHIL